MRVIAGKAKSLRLKTIEGMATRPTTDRIKETLFNMITNDVVSGRFLDLFAGSGGIGIEALSRGATEAVFVEKSSKACAVIKENLSFTHLNTEAKVVCADVLSYMSAHSDDDPYDLIFMDPPYDQEWEKKVLITLRKTRLADSYTLIIVEASLATDFSYLSEYGYELIKEKKYKTNKHMFIRVKE